MHAEVYECMTCGHLISRDTTECGECLGYGYLRVLAGSGGGSAWESTDITCGSCDGSWRVAKRGWYEAARAYHYPEGES